MKALRLAPIVCVLALTTSCVFHSTANHWNGRVGINDKPVYVKTQTSVGFNLGIVLRLLGATAIDPMVDEMTKEIAEENGDRVRVIQSSTENYWYGFPPFTWILTPVVTTVVVDYEPSEEQLAEDAAEEAGDEPVEEEAVEEEAAEPVESAEPADGGAADSGVLARLSPAGGRAPRSSARPQPRWCSAPRWRARCRPAR